MDRHTIVFVTDLRQKHLAEELGTTKKIVEAKDAVKQPFLDEMLAVTSTVVFPIPVSKMLTQMPEICHMTKNLKQELKKDVLMIGGIFSDEMKREMSEKNLHWYDLMEDETVTWQNAKITAEAVIAEILRCGHYSIENQKIIITGYGRCARATAHKLISLGAKVTILARNVEARKLARSEGCVAVDFAYGPQEAYGTRTFINTVPAPVVTERIIREMHKDVLLLDIASAPGGCDLDAAQAYGINVISALGLPGRYTTKSSAMVLAEAIRKKTRSVRGVKEEKSWIYQILPSDMV